MKNISVIVVLPPQKIDQKEGKKGPENPEDHNIKELQFWGGRGFWSLETIWNGCLIPAPKDNFKLPAIRVLAKTGIILTCILCTRMLRKTRKLCMAILKMNFRRMHRTKRQKELKVCSYISWILTHYWLCRYFHWIDISLYWNSFNIRNIKW